ncbi:Glutamyl/glutaminyl-tRNA synthetase, class Ib, alpha-bundle domain,Aminoacyl-tRNA synthetase, class I [Cinara cedri]|uniref:Glutamyl/glutaminyl-tRNA synthetase, class Ib, alpha-bundle domain,Aminoacyl-tRNA synthetase, class I n=1 Tax=Cinara cedri TaxID=506608 RepID=A0A5E4MRW7_9HEMI|nr:Glutamyl/glutaminyl-tRNA synthetase, class Ib, alpha-bundle domain,Aminoacyl-tRNA synthetase, class I [Cinara cedri]
MALSSYLTKLGTSDSIEAHINTQSLIGTFNIEKFSSASTQFNLNKVYQLNSKVLQKMSFDVMKERLHQIGMDSAEFWYFIRGNIDRFSGVNEWWQICKSHINPIILNEEFIKIALDMLPQGNFDKNTLSEWVKAIRQKIDIKTKDLFIQLRLALTGKEAGPELAKLLIFIGREKIITRRITRVCRKNRGIYQKKAAEDLVDAKIILRDQDKIAKDQAEIGRGLDKLNKDQDKFSNALQGFEQTLMNSLRV